MSDFFLFFLFFPFSFCLRGLRGEVGGCGRGLFDEDFFLGGGGGALRGRGLRGLML